MSYRMKKICALLCAATLMGSLSACVAASAISTTKNNTETEATATATSSGQLDASEMFTDRDKEIGYDDTSAVSIELSDSSASCDSRNVTIDGSTITITQEGTYVLSGNLSDGQIVVDADADAAKVQLVLNGVDITKKSSSAIYVKSADKVFVTLADGTENKLTTSGTFETDDDNNIDAVIFSKEDITLNGKGSLTVSTEDGNGITSKDDLKITSGTYNITASGHGLEGKDSVRIADGTIAITAGKDGIHSDNTEDAGKGFVYISGGKLDITSTGDGIDSNGEIKINGGELTIDGPANDGNSAIDIGDGANGYINGGTVIAIGCAGMVEEFDTSSEQAMINVQVSDDNISGEVVLTDSDGNEIISYTPAKSYDCVQISSSMLKTGETYTLKAGDTTTSISLDNIIYSNISGNMRQGA